MLVLSWEQYQSLHQNNGFCESQADPSDPEDQLIPYLPQLAVGHKRDIFLRNGIQMTLHNYVSQQDHKLTSLPPCSECFEIVFNLSSTYRLGNGMEITGGSYYWAYPPTDEIAERQGEHKVAVDLHLKPDLFFNLLGNSFNLDQSSPQPLQKTSSLMQAVLRQILDCPYQGLIKKLYLESKSLELLALILERNTEHQGNNDRRFLLHADDIERIHAASQILRLKMTDPPSILELARSVGLNDCTLKRGFQQVFSTTVFGYLHHHRMDRAAQLLKQQDLTISTVATSVGYASPTSFSTAFRKRFGYSPKQYQLQHR